MELLKVAALVLFVLATLGGFGWGVDWTLHTEAGLIAAGLACEVLAVFRIPQPPSSR